MKKTFTTAEVAGFCHVTRKTVANWIDSGKLESMRTGGGFRKVFRDKLVEFMEKNNIPLGDLADTKKRILIIDDEPAFADIIRGYLEEEGADYEFETAYDGEKGVFKIGLFKPDLVILDIKMPKMDGFKVYDMIKGTPETEDIEILFATAYNEQDIIEGMKKRKVRFILKGPTNKEQWIKTIKEILLTE